MDSVKLNNFSLEILADLGSLFGSYRTPFEPVEKIVYNGGNYFAMPHNTVYKIRLGNNNGVKADAHVWIDGEKIGVWRINSYSRIVIERPANIARKLVLLKENTGKAFKAGIKSGLRENGLIKVTFKPSKYLDYETSKYFENHPYSKINSLPRCFMNYTDTVTPGDKMSDRKCSMDQSYSNCTSESMCKFSTLDNMGSAATALGDTSSQKFKDVEPIYEVNHSQITTVYARLVAENDKWSYKKDLVGLKDAMAKSNKIPERVELRHPFRPHSCSTDSKFTMSRKFWFDNYF